MRAGFNSLAYATREWCTLEVNGLAEHPRLFGWEVAQKYVTGDVITRLEGRIDGMVSSVREEMRAMRCELLEAVLHGRASR